MNESPKTIDAARALRLERTHWKRRFSPAMFANEYVDSFTEPNGELMRVACVMSDDEKVEFVKVPLFS